MRGAMVRVAPTQDCQARSFVDSSIRFDEEEYLRLVFFRGKLRPPPPPVSQNPQFYVQPSSGFCWIPPCSSASFEVNSELHTGARPSVRLCVGLIKRCFWYFWLAIQNTANRHVSSTFDLLAVFISFPLVRAAARPPTPPRPPFGGGGGGKYQKINRL